MLCCSYSYSETFNAQTKNAADQGLTWAMTQVLPQYTGLTVNAVSYRYTAVKLAPDPLLVTVENANTTNTGYVFRSQDDWTGRPGNTLTRTVAVDNIPVNLWGPGRISTVGIGNIQDPQVFYSYRYDTCFDSTTTDPSCPNYKVSLPSIQTNLQTELPENKLVSETEDTQATFKQLFESEQLKKPQVLKKSATNSLADLTVSRALESANTLPVSYNRTLFGGVYSDSVKLVDKRLPDSKNSLRLNYIQELLHTRMINQQYNQGIKND